MLTGLPSLLMNSGPPLIFPMGEEDEGALLDQEPEARFYADQNRTTQVLPVVPTAIAARINTSDTLTIPMESNNLKRHNIDDQDSNSISKRIKAGRGISENVFRGWGSQRNVFTDSEAHTNQNLFGSLFPTSAMQNNMPSNSLVAGVNSSATSNLTSIDLALQHSGLSSVLFRDQIARNHAFNAMFLAKMGNSYSTFNSSHQQRPQPVWDEQRQNGLTTTPMNLQNQLSNLQSLQQLNQMLYGNMTLPTSNVSHHSLLPTQEQIMIRNLQMTNNGQQDIANSSNSNTTNNFVSSESTTYQIPQQLNSSHRPICSPFRSSLELPPCEEGQIEPYNGRQFFSLGINEDPNWLSEFHCFVRSDLVEIYRASNDDVKTRNNSITYQQVGIRCRFCAHLPPSSRSGRSSAFPSSLRQIYQSFTMMLRDHFATCDAMPSTYYEKFTKLKDKPAQGATDSKRYWIYSAKKIGMLDTAEGIVLNQQSRYDGANMASFGTVNGQKWEDDAYRSESLVRPSDNQLVGEFLILLISQVQPIRLTETECIGNRRSLRVGLPGFGCRFCCDQKRFGLCRMFPARRRTLPNKVNDLYEHFRRCALCPQTIKDKLELSKSQMTTSFQSDQGGDREFFDRVWSRLGHSITSEQDRSNQGTA